MSFQFIQNPEGQGLDAASFATSAIDQPMSGASTFWDQAKGGFLSSFGAGTAVRALGTPEAQPPSDGGTVSGVLGAVDRFISPETVVRNLLGTGYNGADPMTLQEYQASPSFRADIPYQNGMTEDRATALAAMDDAKKVREFYAQKRPITSFIGNFAGSAVDPLNYIPVAGEAVASANIARFGAIGGRIASGALDAAGNAALASIATAPTRQELGDDTSWQSTVSQIAMAGLIGAGFGALHGAFGRGASSDLKASALDSLSTLDNVQKSRVALNDAIDGLINDGEVNMSPTSADYAARLADEELPKFTIARMAQDAEPETFSRLNDLNATFNINDAEIRRLQSLSLDNEQFGPTRGAMIEANALGDKLEQIQQQIDTAPNAKERAGHEARLEETKQQLRDKLATIDDTKVQQIEDIDQQLAQRRQVQQPVAAERATLQARADELTSQARDAYWQDRFSRPTPERIDPVNLDDGSVPGTVPVSAGSTQVVSPAGNRKASINTASPREAPDPAVIQAEKRIGKPEASRELAEQFRVNPETGEFPELADIKQLEAEGRLTDEDRAALDDADETLKTANGYGEALKAFARCAI